MLPDVKALGFNLDEAQQTRTFLRRSLAAPLHSQCPVAATACPRPFDSRLVLLRLERLLVCMLHGVLPPRMLRHVRLGVLPASLASPASCWVQQRRRRCCASCANASITI